MELSEGLDKVFVYLNNKELLPEKIESIKERLEAVNVEISLRDLAQIIDKLRKEGFISMRILKLPGNPQEIKAYFITYDGIEILKKHKTYSGFLKHERKRKILKRIAGYFKGIGMAIVGAGLALGTQYITTRGWWLQSIPQQLQESTSQTKNVELNLTPNTSPQIDSIKTDSAEPSN